MILDITYTIYYCNLQRKYVRDNPTVKEVKNFYASFKSWIMTLYASGELTQEEWEVIMEEDGMNNNGDAGRDPELVEEDAVGLEFETESDVHCGFTYNIA